MEETFEIVNEQEISLDTIVLKEDMLVINCSGFSISIGTEISFDFCKLIRYFPKKCKSRKTSSSSKKENITNFEEDLEMAPVTEPEEKAEPEEKTELESEPKGKMKNYAAFSKAMAGSTKRKSK